MIASIGIGATAVSLLLHKFNFIQRKKKGKKKSPRVLRAKEIFGTKEELILIQLLLYYMYINGVCGN